MEEDAWIFDACVCGWRVAVRKSRAGFGAGKGALIGAEEDEGRMGQEATRELEEKTRGADLHADLVHTLLAGACQVGTAWAGFWPIPVIRLGFARERAVARA